MTTLSQLSKKKLLGQHIVHAQYDFTTYLFTCPTYPVPYYCIQLTVVITTTAFHDNGYSFEGKSLSVPLEEHSAHGISIITD